MSNIHHRSVKLTVIASCIAMTFAGCAMRVHHEPLLPSRFDKALAARTVVQVDYGRQARFETCTGGSCSRPTVKTLATDPLPGPSSSSPGGPAVSSAPPTPPADEPSAVPGRGLSQTVPRSTSAANVDARGDDWKFTVSLTSAAAAQGAVNASPRFAAVNEASDAAPPRERTAVAARPAASGVGKAPESPAIVDSGASEEEARVVINFAFSGVKLTPAAMLAIREALPQVRNAQRVVIAGRTDSIGDTNVNQAIALARAISVRDYIKEVAPDIAGAIGIDARGNCCFVASNATQDGRLKNRRVEIVMRGKVDA